MFNLESLERDEIRLEAATGHNNKKHAYPKYNGTFVNKNDGIYDHNCCICRMIYKRFHVLNFPFMVESVASWMPKEWIGVTFQHGWELHQTIDALPAREQKPPTTYCCIYEMQVCDDTTTALRKHSQK